MRYGRSVLMVLVVFNVLLPACSPMTIRDSTTQSFIPMEGLILELYQDVKVPAHRTRVFFQQGVLSYGINEYVPHCQLRVRTISGLPRPVVADRFTIGRVFGSVDQIVASHRILLAAAESGKIAGGGGNGNGNGESQWIYFYFMELRSDKQPDVSYLVCGGALNDPALADYPTIQDIHASLGSYATLLLPDAG